MKTITNRTGARLGNRVLHVYYWGCLRTLRTVGKRIDDSSREILGILVNTIGK